MQNILFVHKGFVAGGGVERVHSNLAEGFLARAKSVSFFVLEGFGESETGFKALSQKHNAIRAEKNASGLKKVAQLWQFIQGQKIDAIISATETANMYTFASKIRFPHLSVIYTRHCALDVSDQKLSPWMIKTLYSIFNLSGPVVAVSKALKEQIKKSIIWQRFPVHYIPNAVLSKGLYDLANEGESFLGAQQYLIAIGRLVEQKGFDLLLHAYSKAIKLAPELPLLVIVGDGKNEVELKQLAEHLGIQKRIVFTGFMENPYYALKQASAFILSSRHEGMPTVLIEALAVNTPVIAFDCPTGPSEIITPSINGCLVEALNIEALAQAIVNYQQLPNENLSKSVQAYSCSKVASAYLSFMERTS